MVRILIAIGEKTFTNPFVSTLSEGLRARGLQVVCSSDEFWHNWGDYDIIHIQWPEQLLKEERGATPEDFENILMQQRAAGKKVVSTCHNLAPHYAKGRVSDRAYDIAYRNSDCMIHLGEYSLDLCKTQYPKVRHALIPHHVYDKRYSLSPQSRDEAVSAFSLDAKYRYILCLGYCRSDEERRLLKNLSDSLRKEKIRILAPQMDMPLPYPNPVKRLREYLRFYRNKIRYRGVICDGKFVPDESLSALYKACDLAFVQHLHLLNSGNVPMAFLMGKVCVGPDVGNVGPFLRSTGNPVFSAEDLQGTLDAVHSGLALAGEGKGESNREYALQNFSTDRIVGMYVDLYSDLMLKR